jgi:hypothetical protein
VLILLDRALDADAFLAEVDAAGVAVPARVKSARKPWSCVICMTVPTCRAWTARVAGRASGSGSTRVYGG